MGTSSIPARAWCGLIILGSIAAATLAAERATSQWVHPGPDGKLVYKTTERGDRIMDFSHAGYLGGGVALPDVPVRKVLHPLGGDNDDTAMIQAAIDEVSKLPLINGFRGAVVLAPASIYNCQETIRISASGVVLRGGQITDGPKATLKLTGRPHGAISVGGGRGRRDAASQPAAATSDGFVEFETRIADTYVPSGSTAFGVENAQGLAVGDWISIRRPVTEAWVRFMEMHDMTRNGRPQTWIRAGTTTNTDRRIAAIEGNRITLEVPLADSLDSQYLNPPGTSVAKIRPPGGVWQVGIENIRIESPPQEISHSQPHFTAMRVNGTDCWVRDVEIFETMNSVGIGGRRITFQNVSITRKARHQGASKPAEFAPNGTQVLLDRCSVSGDNVWFIATGGGVAGPIVMLNCTFKGNGRAESHQRWSTGMLYDNCRAPEGGIELRNRGSMGSGHGWSMGWGVVWNCIAHGYIVQNPPGVMNWMIGSIGEAKLSPRPFGSGPMLPQGTLDSHGKPVAPVSLYLTQLKDRLGPQALKNIGYDSADLTSSNEPAVQPRSEAAPASDKSLGPDLARHRPVLASNAREGRRELNAWQALDGDDTTYWATDDGKLPASIELDTEGALDISAVEIGEAIGMTGRVQHYKVEGFRNSAWETLCEGTTIGQSKMDRFPRVTVWKVRLTILKSESYPAIRKFAMYLTDK
jgi:hypothetical protein